MSIRRTQGMLGRRLFAHQSCGSRVTRTLGAMLLVLAGVLALTGSASAATGHKFLSQLTEAPPGTPLAGPEAVAVDKEGNVFVADGELVNVFDSKGKFKTQLGAGVLEGELPGVAVDASGKVYVADSGTNTIDVFKPNGAGYELLSQWSGANTTSGAFGEVAGVAIDNSTNKADPSAGDVYVVDRAENVVDIFKPKEGSEEASEGSFVGKLKGKFEEPNAIAVNSATGQVYVGDAAKATVYVFPNGTGKLESHITGSGTPTKALLGITAVAVEEATGQVYVVDAGARAVDQFAQVGLTFEWMGWVTEAAGAPFSEALHGVAVTSTNLYVADAENTAVDVFGPNIVVPSVVTNKATKITRTTATLNGFINTLGKPAKYHFEYGEPEGPLTSTPTVETTGEEKVLANVTGLKAGVTYEFRLVAENENGRNNAVLLPFTTPPAVTAVTTGAATVTPTTATLNGSLEPEGLETTYHFEYGETTSYGASTPAAKTNGTGVVPVAATLTGLKPNTVYHFALVASNEFGETFGGDARFKTSGPPAITNGATAPIGHTTATVNAQINPGELATKYHLAYGPGKCLEGATTPDAEIPPGENPVPVKFELKELKLATTYHFCVVASNAATEPEHPAVGPEQEFTTVLIEGESAKEVRAESAVLQTLINPLGVDTKYHFEYGETAAYGTSVPVPDEDLGAPTGDQIREQTLTGLHPGTTYHYRVVVSVEGITEKGFGADQTFTTPTGGSGGSAKLPDGRAYEMVSPPNKRGGFIEALTRNGGAIQSSEDGNAFAFVVDGPIVESPEGNRSPEAQQAISTRGATEWTAQEIVTPHDRPWGLRAGRPPEYQFFSPDLSLAFVQPFPYGLTPLAEPALSPPLSEAERGHQEKTMYVRNDAPIAPAASEATVYEEAKRNGELLSKEQGEAEAKPGYLPLVTPANVAPGAKFGGNPLASTRVEPNILFLSAAPDLTHAVFRSTVALAPEGPSAPGLYEWGAGKLQMVSVLPNGKPSENGVAAIDLGFGFAGQPTNYRHAISNDGSRVVWTDDETTSTGLGHIYLRDTVKKETLQLDAPEAGPIAEAGKAQFQIASADGSKVFFTDTQRLTGDSTAGLLKADLYECAVVEVAGKLACALTDLTVDHSGGESAAVQGAVLGASEDASSLYLVARGALAPGAESGANNLYALHNDGSKWATRLVARLNNEDNPDWFTRNRLDLVNLTARVSPNGRFLAFMSNRRLTGYDNTDVIEPEELVENKMTKVRHADEEVFLYSADTEAIACASCNPSGARPTGVFDTQLAGEGAGLLVDRPETWTSTNTSVAHWLAGSIPGWTAIDETESNHQSRYLSDSGRLFFTSADPLLPEVTTKTRKETVNGTVRTVGVENVYQYEPNSVGSCASASGCVALISNGTSERESAFLDASASGNDVFFLTAAKLLPQDVDGSYDVYDARVCGEAGCQTPPSPPATPCTSTEECRSGSPATPTFQSPPSSTFSGPGNALHPVPAGGTLPTKVTKPAPLTKAQRLARALKACRKLPHKTRAQKKKRATCEAHARRKYGAKKAKHASRASNQGKGA